MATNINGPSLIRVPDWVAQPLGRYYLYFAHHHGQFIRLAYADDLNGPWRVYTPGVLHLDSSYCVGHVASPDVYIDHAHQQIRLYYHGGSRPEERAAIQPEIDEQLFWTQRSRVAVSRDGRHFTAYPDNIASVYLRVFDLKGQVYGLTMPGLLYRSQTGFGPFEPGPLLLGDDARRADFFFPPGQPSVRHLAVEVVAVDRLRVYYSRALDAPECILVSEVDARADDWHDWQVGPPQVLLTPDTPVEGADLPLRPSQRGSALARVRELRDPAFFREGDRRYLLYSIAGEQGIGIAELIEEIT
jgi:hypothetical protein